MFCKICGGLLQLKLTPYGKWMSCGKGHFQPQLVQHSEPLTFKIKPTESSPGIADDHNVLAVHQHRCQKCGYELAELIEIAPFYSDEDSLIKMKCGRCGAIERLEGKIT